jgi:phosphinothricin acetyltransferase
MTHLLRPCASADVARVCEIYNHYVHETVVTFEEAPVAAPEMERRIGEVTARWPWLVCEHGGKVAGYAYATTWRPRSAYRYSVESTVYLAPESTGRGLGRALYGALLAELRARGAHCVLGGIALPNAASVALHERLGFRKVGELEEVGFKHGRWVNVGYWQLTL